MPDFLPFASPLYWVFVSILLFARGMDFLSTWIASPNLLLEANPIARRLGWKWGVVLNLVLCLTFAMMPLAAVVITTSSMLVAARNFQSACLMRAMGESHYSFWYSEQLASMPKGLYLFCFLAQTILVFLVGAALILFSREMIPFGIGMGIIAYTLAVSLFTLLARLRGSIFNND
jgi:hypothetical protein